MVDESTIALVREFLHDKSKVQKTARKNLEVFLRVHPDLKGKVTAKTFEDILSKNENVQVFKKLPKPKEYLPIFSKNANSFQMDIVFMQDIGNSRYHYLLTAIDVNSRMGYAYPLKSKSYNEVGDAVDKFAHDVLQNTHAPVYSITTDQGSEFSKLTNNETIKNARLFYANQGDKHKMGKIERFHRTLREKFKDILPNFEHNDWVEVLPEILTNYNQYSSHRALGKPPADYNIEDFGKQYKNYKHLYRTLIGELPDNNPEELQNDNVRVRSSAMEKQPNPFKKNTFETPLTRETYNVAHIFPSGTVALFKKGYNWNTVPKGEDHGNYLIQDEKMIRRFKPYDLAKSNHNIEVPLNEKFFNKIRIHKQKRRENKILKQVGIDSKNIIDSKRIRIKNKKYG